METESEVIICAKQFVCMYQIPASVSTRRQRRAAEWNLANPDWVGSLRVITKGKSLRIDFLDARNGQLYAKAPITNNAEFQGIEGVSDSSRYFVIRLMNDEGRHAFVGIGFNERNDSFDFNVSIKDHFTKDEKAEKLKREFESQPKLDLQVREGQKIGLKLDSNIVGKKKDDFGATKSSKHGGVRLAQTSKLCMVKLPNGGDLPVQSQKPQKIEQAGAKDDCLIDMLSSYPNVPKAFDNFESHKNLSDEISAHSTAPVKQDFFSDSMTHAGVVFDQSFKSNKNSEIMTLRKEANPHPSYGVKESDFKPAAASQFNVDDAFFTPQNKPAAKTTDVFSKNTQTFHTDMQTISFTDPFNFGSSPKQNSDLSANASSNFSKPLNDFDDIFSSSKPTQATPIVNDPFASFSGSQNVQVSSTENDLFALFQPVQEQKSTNDPFAEYQHSRVNTNESDPFSFHTEKVANDSFSSDFSFTSNADPFSNVGTNSGSSKALNQFSENKVHASFIQLDSQGAKHSSNTTNSDSFKDLATPHILHEFSNHRTPDPFAASVSKSKHEDSSLNNANTADPFANFTNQKSKPATNKLATPLIDPFKCFSPDVSDFDPFA